MNMISELRQRVRQNGKAEITPEEFDRLQAEWIMRAGAGKLILAEREACKQACAETAVLLPGHHEYTALSVQKMMMDAISERSNAEIRGGEAVPLD